MLKFLSGTVTQGSADAFATAEMATGLANANLAYRVRGIIVHWPGTVEVDSDIQVQLCRRTPAALLGLADRTLLWLRQRQLIITTSGQTFYERVTSEFFSRDLDLLIVEDPVHISIDSTTTGLSNTAVMRVYYEEVKVTPLEKVTALSESLNA
jgi:hypothetical protein